MAIPARRMLLFVAAALVALMMVLASAGMASAAETYKGKGNGYGWAKNGGAFPGGGGCDFAC